MYLATSCSFCVQEDSAGPKPGPLVEWIYGPLRDDGLLVARCGRGHEICLLHTNHRFEILFELAVAYLVDGYYLGAVVPAAAARESFFEFYLRHYWTARGHDANAKWRSLETSSRTQFKTFRDAYLDDTGRAYAGESEQYKGFRDDVVHRGKIPTPEQVADYLRWVHDRIVEAGEELRARHGTVTHVVGFAAQDRAREAAGAHFTIQGHLGHGLSLRWGHAPWHTTFDEAVQRSRETRSFRPLALGSSAPPSLFFPTLGSNR